MAISGVRVGGIFADASVRRYSSHLRRLGLVCVMHRRLSGVGGRGDYVGRRHRPRQRTRPRGTEPRPPGRRRPSAWGLGEGLGRR